MLTIKRLLRMVVQNGSPARTRTSDLVVTLDPKLLSEVDYIISVIWRFILHLRSG